MIALWFKTKTFKSLFEWKCREYTFFLKGMIESMIFNLFIFIIIPSVSIKIVSRGEEDMQPYDELLWSLLSCCDQFSLFEMLHEKASWQNYLIKWSCLLISQSNSKRVQMFNGLNSLCFWPPTLWSIFIAVICSIHVHPVNWWTSQKWPVV